MECLNKTIQHVEELYKLFYKQFTGKYDKNIDIINTKLYKLYLLYYEKYNLSFIDLNSLKGEDKTIFIKKRTYLINKLMNLKKKIMFIKESSYPWPWSELDNVDISVGFRNKKSMELLELKYVNEYSVKLYYSNLD